MKKTISNILKEISDYLEFKGENFFKVKTYREASKIIENLPYELNGLSDIERLREISGIGDTIVTRIKEIVNEGKSIYLENLKKEFPLDLEDLLSIPGLGVKKIRLFYDKLNIRNIEDLKDAVYSGKLLSLPRIGNKVVENIKRGIEFREKNRGYPFPLAFDIIRDFTSSLKLDHSSYYITGELRRKKEFIQSFDLIIFSYKNSVDKFSTYLEVLQKDRFPHYERIMYKFNKVSGIIYITSSRFLWHVLFLSTGSLGHVRYVLNAYNERGISFWNESFKNEGEIYKKIGFSVIPPILREDRGEFDWYSSFDMISKRDLKGDFHLHSVWSDGQATIKEIVEEAYLRRYEYIGISDHSASLYVAGGLSVDEVYQKEDEILKLRSEKPKVYPLLGAEVDIRPDGSLDYPDEILKRFDYVIASIHTNFGMGFEENTRRIISAIRNPYVIAFAHPTGRELGIRPGYDFDRKKVFEEAEKNGVLLEVNGTPRRMDLDSYELFRLRDSGIKFILSSDAHHLSSFSNIENSIVIANKGGISSNRVVNTYTLKDALELFNSIRKRKLKR